MNQVEKLAEKNQEYVIALRRHFRKNPELSGREFLTQQRIMDELAAMHISFRKAVNTGIIAEIEGSLPGRTIAVRADMDALPLQDEIEKEYRSVCQGVSHACGHDGHTAMLLGLAKLFSELREELPGKIRFIFQPSEEKFPGGAQRMVAEGAMEDVDTVIGTHLWEPVLMGKIGLSIGPMMASPHEFTITIQGRGGHASMPEEAIDPIVAGAHLVLALRAIPANNVSSNEQCVLSIGSFQAGTVFNIIPDKAVIMGTVRTFSDEIRDQVFAKIHEFTQNICRSFGTVGHVDYFYGYPAVINHAEMAQVLIETAGEILGPENVQIMKPGMVAEDFSYYQQEAPGVFFYTGIQNQDKGCIYPHHHPKFDMDEDALLIGVKVMARTVLKLLHKEEVLV